MSKIDLSKEVAKLVGIANSTLMRERVSAELDVVIADLSAKEQAKSEKKKAISGTKYPDVLSDFSKSINKNIEDLLKPAFEEDIKIAKSSAGLSQTLTEIFGSMQLDIMRAIKVLETEIKTITLKAEVPSKVGQEEVVLSEAGNQAIIGEITKRNSKLEELQRRLNEISNDIVTNILNKAMASSKARMSELRAEKLKEELLLKSSSLISYERVLDEEIVLSLEGEIKSLRARKELLKTSPEQLGQDILSLQKEGKQEEALVKFRSLTLLSRGTSVGLIPENVSRFITVPVSMVTLNQLGREEKSHQGSLLYLQKNSEYRPSNIAKTAAGIASCLKAINEVELLKEQIEMEKSIAESNNDLKYLATLRRNLLDLEPLVTSLKQMIDEYYVSMGSEIDYINNNLALQGAEQYLLSQTSMLISEIESGIKLDSSSSIQERIEQIGFTALSIQEHYQVSSDQESIEETITSSEEPGMIGDLLGEQYDVSGKTTENKPLITDLLAPENDPNSFTSQIPIINNNAFKEPSSQNDENVDTLGISGEIDGNSLVKAIFPENIYAKRTGNLNAILPTGALEESKPLEKIPMPFQAEREKIYSKRTGESSPLGEKMTKPSTSEETIDLESAKRTTVVEEMTELEPIEVATTIPADNKPEIYTPYRERTGTLSPFRIGRPTMPGAMVVSSKGVSFTQALIDAAYKGVARDLEGKQTIGIRRLGA